jgi:hypothetical protein
LYTYGVLGPQEKFGYIHLQTSPWCARYCSCSLFFFGPVQALQANNLQLPNNSVKNLTTTTATRT